MPAVGPQLVPIAFVPGQVGSLSSEQSQVPDRLSFVQNSAQIRFRLSSEHLRLSSSPDPEQVQTQSSSGSAQIRLTLSSMHTPLRSGSDSAQIKFSSGSGLDQVHTHLSSNQVHLSSGSDQVRAGSAKLGFKLCSNQAQLSSDQVHSTLTLLQSSTDPLKSSQVKTPPPGEVGL